MEFIVHPFLLVLFQVLYLRAFQWYCKLIQPLQKSIWWFFTKQGIDQPQDPAISLLITYPKDTPSYHKNARSIMSIIALIITVTNWKQPICPSNKVLSLVYLKELIRLHSRGLHRLREESMKDFHQSLISVTLIKLLKHYGFQFLSISSDSFVHFR